jgi:hypothetical protein
MTDNKITKKLPFEKQTVRNLTASELQLVAGGATSCCGAGINHNFDLDRSDAEKQRHR